MPLFEPKHARQTGGDACTELLLRGKQELSVVGDQRSEDVGEPVTRPCLQGDALPTDDDRICTRGPRLGVEIALDLVPVVDASVEVVVRGPGLARDAVAVDVQHVVQVASARVVPHVFDDERPPLVIAEDMQPRVDREDVAVVEHREREGLRRPVELIEDVCLIDHGVPS